MSDGTDRHGISCSLFRCAPLGEVLHHAPAPLIRLLFTELNPAPLKALLARQGLIGDELCPPLTAAATELVARLAALR